MADVATWMSVALAAGGAVLGAGAAAGGMKVALNGTRGRVKSLEQTFADHAKADEKLAREVIDRLARIETLLESRNSDKPPTGRGTR